MDKYEVRLRNKLKRRQALHEEVARVQPLPSRFSVLALGLFLQATALLPTELLQEQEAE